MSESTYAKGCLPRSTKLGEAFRVPGKEVLPLIDRAALKSCTMRGWVWHVIDQGRQNSCCPCATAGALMLLRHVFGLEKVVLSQASLYRFINGGRDAGASLDSALKQVTTVGVAPASVVEPTNWRANPPWPTTWVQEAARFKGFEWWDLPTAQHVASAVSRGWPCVIGVDWAGGGGHAIVAHGLSVGSNASLEYDILNSWGGDWGDNGCGYLPEDQVADGIRTFGAFALRAIIQGPAEPLPTPV